MHEQLTACLADNPQGIPYALCSRACIEGKYWVLDKGQSACFSETKVKSDHPYEINSVDADGKAVHSWLVCVDEGLITNSKSNRMARCDNLLFNDDVFYFVEAKMRVKGKNFQKEFEDAIRNKIPKTKALLDGKMSEMGYAISQKMGIAIPFSAAEYIAPRNISQKAESSRQDARKFAGTWVCNLTLDETIVL